MPTKNFITRDACPVCGAQRARELYAAAFDKPPVREYLDRLYAAQGHGVEYEYLAGAQFVVLACAGCGLLYQRDVPAEDLMRRLYGRWIKPEKVFALDAGKPRGRSESEFQMLLLYMKIARSSNEKISVYDYGMGWGIWLLSAQAAGCDVYGTDIIAEKCAVAASGGVICIQEEDLPGKTFDLINAEHVLEHTRYPREVLGKLAGALKPEGLLRIVVPVASHRQVEIRLKSFGAHPVAATNDRISAISPLEHLNCFCGNSLKDLAKACGLERVHVPLALRYFYTFEPTIKGLLRPLASLFSYRFMPIFFRRR